MILHDARAQCIVQDAVIQVMVVMHECVAQPGAPGDSLGELGAVYAERGQFEKCIAIAQASAPGLFPGCEFAHQMFIDIDRAHDHALEHSLDCRHPDGIGHQRLK